MLLHVDILTRVGQKLAHVKYMHYFQSPHEKLSIVRVFARALTPITRKKTILIEVKLLATLKI